MKSIESIDFLPCRCVYSSPKGIQTHARLRYMAAEGVESLAGKGTKARLKNEIRTKDNVTSPHEHHLYISFPEGTARRDQNECRCQNGTKE